ncbi:MAG: ATP-binding cassette domain-containing protein [Clostridia bacterium]|nr:ATP-binding cassette domain-containing protein [Clostridia bacterium]
MLDVKELCVSQGGMDILENVSFHVFKGEYISIVGENGSGKSTLIKAVLGQILKKSGTVTFSEEVKRIGYLPQQNKISNFPASVMEVVLSGCLNRLNGRPFYSKEEKALANEYIERLGIEKLKKRNFLMLSGGERQRALLARAMCAGEDMLVLDEPVTGLDPLVTEDMYRIIGEFNKERKVTVLTVSHDIPAAVRYSEKILHLGKSVRFFGTSEEYVKSEIGIHFTGRCCEHV